MRTVSIAVVSLLFLAGVAIAQPKGGGNTGGAKVKVYDFSGDMHRHEQRLREWLSACRTGDVLMCHPSAGIMPGDPHGDARLREYKALLALPLEAGRNSGITLSPLSRCLRRG